MDPVVAADERDGLSDDELAAELSVLLESLADAAVSAGGFFVPMPTTVPLSGQTVIRGHQTALELVVPQDLHLVIGAWQDATIRGSASVTVRPLGAAESSLTIHYIDARPQHGVFLCFLVGDLDRLTARRGDAGAMRPRVSIVRKSGQAVFISVDDAAITLLGRDDLVGQRNIELVHPDDTAMAIASWMDMLASPGQSRRIRLRQKHRDGSWVWFEITNHNLLNDPAERCIVAEMVDISEEMAAHEFVRTQERLLRRLTDSLPVGIAQADAGGIIVHRNQRLTAILGHPNATAIAELFSSLADEHHPAFHDAVATALTGSDKGLEVEMSQNGDTPRRCHLTLRALGGGNGFIVCVDDITDRARLRDQLHHRATFDALTECHNRASTLHEVGQALCALAAGNSHGVTVVFIDLDGFKAVNDQQGHAAGDTTLRRVSRCLRDTMRSSDIVGRIGGDEFLVLSTSTDSAHQALILGDRIADALAATITPTPGHHAAASIGVAWTSSHELTPSAAEDLISAADAAMYESKRNGDGRPVPAAHVPSPLATTV